MKQYHPQVPAPGGSNQRPTQMNRMALVGKLRSLLCFIVFVYMLPPVIFRYSPLVQRSLLFMNYANTQNGVNLSHPEQVGIKCSRALQLEHPNEMYASSNGRETHKFIKLGVWHILPESSLTSCITTEHNNRTFIEDSHAFVVDTRPIVLYIHGNGGNRAGNYRSRLYRRLAYEHDFHVVTFDYRGYGDSTNESPSTFGLHSDARFVYNWLLSQSGVTRERVSVWGHSLGTAVAIRMVAGMSHEQQPARLILEAPFDSIANALASHPWTALHRNMPYFEQFIVDPIESTPELNFDSLKHIGRVKTPSILIMHAQDDPIVAHKLGKNLHDEAQRSLGKSKVMFISIPANFKLGHTNIGTHNETLLQVKKYIETETV